MRKRLAWLLKLGSGILIFAGVLGCGPDTYATMNSPKHEAVYASGDTIRFSAEVNSDTPLGINREGDWRWTSDVDGDLGNTALFFRSDLSVGEHLITLRVMNVRDVVLRDRAKIRVVDRKK